MIRVVFFFRKASFLLSLCILTSIALGASTPSTSTARDTIFLDPLPSAPRLQDLLDKSHSVAPNPFYQSTLPRIIEVLLFNRPVPYSKLFDPLNYEPITSLPIVQQDHNESPMRLNQFLLGRALDNQILTQITQSNYNLLKEERSKLLASRVTADFVEVSPAKLKAPKVKLEPHIEELPSFTLARKYWKFGYESLIQFSQNYVSKNWHKGGGNNLNLYNRQYFNATYTRDKISWMNELEWRLSAYTSEADTISKFRVADDLLRLHSNFGLQAYKSLYYTLDAEVKTSLFTRREENKREVLSALFSPVNFNVGLGMRYSLDWNSPSFYGRKIKLSVILSPLAYDLRWSYKTKGMDLTRHGFALGKNFYQAIGSTLRADCLFDITSAISWQSRFYYNTSYHRVEIEWDNSLNLAISRFFSTRFMVQLRFDDAVPRSPENRTKLQFNELFSFGFRYIL